MRRYDDPVEVRRDTTDQHGPEQFLWRGRLFKVRSVLAHWVLGADGAPATAPARVLSPVLAPPVRPPDGPPDGPLSDRELWRVRAGRGGLESDEVYDLSFDSADGSWQLVGSSAAAGSEGRP